MYGKGLVLLAALSLPLGGAGDAAIDRATLKGIATVNVVIDPVGEELQNQGVTASAMVARLEEKLRARGITVDRNSSEFVALRLTSVRAARNPLAGGAAFAVAATIGLYQPVMLVRDRNIRTATQTWEVETISLADTKQVYRACMDSVDELATRFVIAWRSANLGSEARPPEK
jgi:hypothetical protein